MCVKIYVSEKKNWENLCAAEGGEGVLYFGAEVVVIVLLPSMRGVPSETRNTTKIRSTFKKLNEKCRFLIENLIFCEISNFYQIVSEIFVRKFRRKLEISIIPVVTCVKRRDASYSIKIIDNRGFASLKRLELAFCSPPNPGSPRNISS